WRMYRIIREAPSARADAGTSPETGEEDESLPSPVSGEVSLSYGDGGGQDAPSLGKEELLGPGVAGAAQGPVVAERLRHVLEPGVGHHHALHHGCEPDRADLVHLVDPDAVEFLAELDLLVRPDRARLVDDLDDALGRRIRLGALLALRLVPAPPQRA